MKMHKKFQVGQIVRFSRAAPINSNRNYKITEIDLLDAEITTVNDLEPNAYRLDWKTLAELGIYPVKEQIMDKFIVVLIDENDGTVAGLFSDESGMPFTREIDAISVASDAADKHPNTYYIVMSLQPSSDLKVSNGSASVRNLIDFPGNPGNVT